MSGQLGELVISLAADTARFRADLGKATKATQDASKDMTAHFEKMGSAVKTTIGLMAGLAGVASLGALVKGSIDAADNMSKMSQKVGVAIDQLSGMAYAASLADVSTEQLGKGMGKLAKLMYEAAGDKDGGPAETFKTLGVSVTDAAGKLRNTDDVMMDVADRLAGMDDGAAKTALAMEVFGKAGADLIPLLNGGKQGIREAADEAKRFGLVLTEEAGKQAEEFNDNLTRMGSQATGAAMALVNELAPAVLQLMDGISKGDGLNTSPLITFITGIGDVVRNTQREAVSMIATFDKMAAWVNTGGTLRHLISKKDAAEYARQLQVINEAKAAAIKDIYSPEEKPEAVKKKGSGTGSTGKAKTGTDAAARLAEQKKAGEAFREQQIEEGTRLIELQEKIGEEFRENQIAEDTRLLELRQERLEAFIEAQIEEGVRLIELKEQQEQEMQNLIASLDAGILRADGSGSMFTKYQEETAAVQRAADAKLTIRLAEIAKLAALDKDEVANTIKKNALIAKAQEEHDKTIAKSKELTGEIALNSLSDTMGRTGDMLMQGNKEQFEAGKKFAIASAGISIALGAIEAYTSMAKFGLPGQVLGAMAATALVAAGTQQIAMISSQQFPGRALGGPVEAGQTYIVNENRATQGPEYFTPSVSGTITPANKMGGGQGVSVTQVLQITAGVPEIVRSEISRMGPMIKSLAVQAVQQAQRGGQLQRA